MPSAPAAVTPCKQCTYDDFKRKSRATRKLAKPLAIGLQFGRLGTMKTLKLVFDLVFFLLACIGVWTCWPVIGPCVNATSSAISWAFDVAEDTENTIELVSSPEKAAAGMVESAMAKTVEVTDALASDAVEVTSAVWNGGKTLAKKVRNGSPISFGW